MENPNREGRTNMRNRAGDAGSPQPSTRTSTAGRVSPSYVRPSPHWSSSDHCCSERHASYCSQCYSSNPRPHPLIPIPASVLRSRTGPTSCSDDSAIRGDGCTL